MLTVELAGGPQDGGSVTWTDAELDAIGGPGRIPAEIEARRGWAGPTVGRYVMTRKLSKATGHLIYEWRPGVQAAAR